MERYDLCKCHYVCLRVPVVGSVQYVSELKVDEKQINHRRGVVGEDRGCCRVEGARPRLVLRKDRRTSVARHEKDAAVPNTNVENANGERVGKSDGGVRENGIDKRLDQDVTERSKCLWWPRAGYTCGDYIVQGRSRHEKPVAAAQRRYFNAVRCIHVYI